jgi:hypothetical protein
MPSTRLRRTTFGAVLLGVLVAPSLGRAQGDTGPETVRSYCIKVQPGKAAEYEAFLRDVALPLLQARADLGGFQWAMLTRSVYPQGSSAQCDYSAVYGYKGFPPEEPAPAAVEAALKKAKIPLTADQLAAKRGALVTLVAAEIWSRIDGTGPAVGKGGYIAVNHYKVKDGQGEQWVRYEKEYWKPLVEAWNKAGGKGGWGVWQLAMPAGEVVPYDVATVDTFADWDTLAKGVFSAELWGKVHPGMSGNEALGNLDKVRSVHDREVSRIEAVIVPAAAK